MSQLSACPCGSKKPYTECCKPYHDGVAPKTALHLMKSRYSAYALGLVDYIIATTHPDNPSFHLPREQWKRQILEFCRNTRFEGLKILESNEGEKIATVTFTAYLKQNGKDATFTEKSDFEKQQGRWLYKTGVML
jgi:SEC-C motif domain protein